MKKVTWFYLAIVLALLTTLALGCAGANGNSYSFSLSPTEDGTVRTTPCLYDPASRTYKECFHVNGDGSCAQYGAPCSVQGTGGKTPCVFDPGSSSYRDCLSVTSGGCAQYGNGCTP
jgi:hypothetical protein